MNEHQLIEHMKNNGAMAKVGKPETMEAALALEKRGIVARVGEWSGPNPGTVFHITQSGMETFGYRASPIDQLRKKLSVAEKKSIDVSIKERPIVA